MFGEDLRGVWGCGGGSEGGVVGDGAGVGRFGGGECGGVGGVEYDGCCCW